MYQLIYISTATINFKQPQLLSLLLEARSRNARLGVTGMLLFCEGNFIQVLEGSKEAVDEVFVSIKEDARHTGIIVVNETPVFNRSFAEWSMGFESTSINNISSLPGYHDITSLNFREKLANGKDDYVMNVLASFEQSALKATA